MNDLQPINGTATLSPDEPVIAGCAGTWTLTYTAGEDEIRPGGVLRLTIPGGFTPPQVDHPGAPGYVTASCAADQMVLTLTVEEDEEGNPEPGGLQGFHVKVFLDSAPLRRRGHVVVVYGDRSGDSPGAFARQAAGEVVFRVEVQTGQGEMTFRPLRQSPVLRVAAGKLHRLTAILPSLVETEKPFAVGILPCDVFGNVTDLSTERVSLKAERGDLTWPSAFALRTADTPLRASAKTPGGPCRIRVTDEDTGIEGLSNPLFASDRLEEVLLWGDLHGHTTLSDGSASPEAYFAYGRDVARLDFVAITDHLDPGVREESRWETARASAMTFDEAGRFIPLIGVETRDATGGHLNLYFQGLNVLMSGPGDASGLPVCEEPVNGNGNALMVSHAHGRITWATPELRSLRLAEVYSCWGSAERWGAPRSNTHPSRHPGGTIQAALAYGLKLGMVAGSDTHAGVPGNAVRIRMQPRHPGGLTAVYADAFTRPAFWAGLRSRRCYATTGARIILRFEIEGYPMGSDVDIGGPDDPLIKGRSISVKVYGTSRISRIDVVRNNADICSYRGDNDVVQFRWVDAQDLSRVSTPRPASRHPLTSYYVRVVQEDGEMAWSSPIWLALTYLP